MAAAMDAFLSAIEVDKSFSARRRNTVIAFSIRMFLIGVEYAIILPSIWLYLKTFNVQSWYLGIVVASYTVASMLSLPVCGRLYDRTRRTKAIIVVMNCFEIVGNLLYSLNLNSSLPLIGRFVAGLGDGFFAAANGEVSAVYPVHQRTGIFALMELGRVFGITFGPSLNLFLQNVDVWLGRWHLNFGTIPGFFMVFVWILMELLTVCLVHDLSREHKQHPEVFVEISLRAKKNPTLLPDDTHYSVRETAFVAPGSPVVVNDQLPLLSGNSTHADISYTTRETLSHSTEGPPGPRPHPTLMESIAELCSLEILAIFYADLVLWLAQTEFEVLAPLITQEDFGWHETYLSVIYMLGGLELIGVFVCIWLFGSRVKDLNLLLTSLCLSSVALVLLVVYKTQQHNRSSAIAVFCVIAFLVFLSIPLNLVASKSLLTKITRSDTQGFTQGVYASVSRVALIAGPIMASSAFSNLAVFGCIMSLSCVIGIGWIIACMGRIHERVVANNNI